MSLRIWLPLNGNLDNYGLDQSVYISSTADLNSGAHGKIGGKCCYFNNKQITIDKPIIPLGNPEWSFACWFQLSQVKGTMTFFSERKATNTSGYTIFLLPKTKEIYVDDGVRWSFTLPDSFSGFNSNDWYHLVVTKSANEKRIYLNGVLQGNTTTVGTSTAINSHGCLIGACSTADNLTSVGNYFQGYLNDVRIYNHCLSAKEVNELSKALIIHYKLEAHASNYNYYDNIHYDNIHYDNSGYYYNNSHNNLYYLNNGDNVYFNGTTSQIKLNNTKWISDQSTEFTINFWIKSNSYDSKNLLYLSGDNSFSLTTDSTRLIFSRYEQSTGFITQKSLSVLLSKLIANQWNMISIVYKANTNSGISSLFYINGKNINSDAGYVSLGIRMSDGILYLGNNGTNISSFQGEMKDFRFYYTALSSEDIKELYSTSVIIDKNGNLYSQEIIENSLEQQNLKINKNTILSDSFEEGFSQCSFTKNGIVKNNIIYEY